MNKELLKNVLRLKLSLAERITAVLPESIQEPVKDLEKLLIQALYEVTKEYVTKEPSSETGEQASGLKTIDVL